MTAGPRDSIRFSTYSIPGDVDLLFKDGEPVPLEPQAVRVLRYLAVNNGRVVSKEELLENVWPGVFTTDGVLKRAISQVRRALGDNPSESRFIATYHARGYRFLGTIERSAGDEGGDAPRALPEFDQLAGRESELTLLESELSSALRGAPRPVMILGDAGIGKTQLARRFQLRAADSGARTAYLRFFDYGGSQLPPYQTFVDLLQRMNPDGESTLFSQDARVRAGQLGDPWSVIVPICQELEKLASDRALVLVLDDLQWATEAELDLVSYLLRSTGSDPFMIVMTARLEDMASEERPLASWMRREAARRSFTTIQLSALSQETCRAAIASVFGSSPDFPDPQLESIFDVSRGNPFFLMEILRLLIADGLLQPREGAWIWTGASEIKLPESLVLLAEARLERLDVRVRNILDAAAVLGDEFRVRTLAHLTGIPEDELDHTLEEAVRQGVVTRRNVSPGEDCRFYHTIIRRIVYDRISASGRVRLHAAAAAALEAVYAADRHRIAEAASVHYEAAGDRLRTFDASLEAWRAASSRWEWRRALAAVERAERAAKGLAAEGAPLSRSRQTDLALALAETLFSVGRLREAERILTDTLQISSELEGTVLPRLLLLRGRTAIALSRYRRAAADLRRAVELFSQAGDTAGELRARIELGGVEAAMGRYEKASEILTDALERLEPGSDLAAFAYGVFGWATALQGNYEIGAQLLTRAIDATDRTTNLRHRALLIRRLHWVELTRGNYEQAIELALRARDEFRRIGDAAGEAKANMGLGQARMAQGIYGEAIAYLHETQNNLANIGDVHCEAETLWLLGRATLESGDRLSAAPMLDRALRMVREIGDRDDEFRILIDVARLRLEEQDPEAAGEAARSAEAIASELRNSDGIGLATSEIARSLLLAGNVAAAIDKARTAVQLLQHSGLGERWRAAATLGECLVAARKPRNAVPELQRAVEVLETVRNQAPPDHRHALSRVHARIPIQLESALREIGRTAEADELRRGWDLEATDSTIN